MNISDKVIDRLTLYHCILTEYLEKNIAVISSPQIASLLNIDDSQVRKDLKHITNIGKCRVGYDVQELKKAIEKTLGFADTKNVFIVGAGNLGSALTQYDDFANYGLNIVALFDNDQTKIGTTINGKKVYRINKLAELAKQENVEIAILTVPRNFAQKVTDFLVKSGIKNIWNFTPSVLKTPKDINVWNENFMGSCLQFIAHNKKEV